MSSRHEIYESDLLQNPPNWCQEAETNSALSEELEAEVVDELLRILVESLKEINTKSRELLLRKFFDEVEKETSLEGFEGEAKSAEKMFANATQRGLDVGSHHRLERFKIRTPNLDGVVKEEPNGNSKTEKSSPLN